MNDKFSHLPGPLASANQSWDLCPVCVMTLPHCLCEYQRIAGKMLREFENNRNLWARDFWGNEGKRTPGCSYEPKMELMMKLLSTAVKELKIKTGVYPV